MSKFDQTHKVLINGVPHTAYITKSSTTEWRLTILDKNNFPNVFNHSPEKCLEAAKLQWCSKSSENTFCVD